MAEPWMGNRLTNAWRGMKAAARSMFVGVSVFASAMTGPLDHAAKGVTNPTDQAALTRIRLAYAGVGSAATTPVRTASVEPTPTRYGTTTPRGPKPGGNTFG